MRTQAFGREPQNTLLASEAVAQTALDVLISPWTGHIVDVRRDDTLAAHLSAAEVLHEEEPDDGVPTDVDALALHRG